MILIKELKNLKKKKEKKIIKKYFIYQMKKNFIYFK